MTNRTGKSIIRTEFQEDNQREIERKKRSEKKNDA
jgi:hypothetical protein